MPGYNLNHVRHTAIAQFDVVLIADFMQTMGRWEMFCEQSRELVSDVSFTCSLCGGLNHTMKKPIVEPKKAYIGQSKRNLKTKLVEHDPITYGKSDVTDHLRENPDHTIDTIH